MNEKVKAAIASIDKKWGKGAAIVSLTEKDASVKRCPTGSLALDIALGGGYPYGRIVEIFGPESSGKCLSENSYIATSNGYKTVGEIFAENQLELLTTNKEVEREYSLVNKDIDLERTTHFTYNGKKPLYKITTQSGYCLERTHKHPLLVLNKDGIMIWKWTGELEVGDCLLSPRYLPFGYTNNPSAAYSCGLLIADGCFVSGNTSITNDDPYIVKWILEKLPASLGIRETKIKHKSENKCGTTSYEIELQDSNLWKKLYKWDFEKVKAKDKKIPKWIREGNKETIAAYLRGYMDVESYISDSGLEVSSASYKLLYETKLLLSQFGIMGTLSSYYDKKYEKDYWTLLLTGSDFFKYLSEIGVSSFQKKEQIKAVKDRINEDITQDSYPNINELIKDLYKLQSKRTDKFAIAIEDLRHDKVRCTYRRLKKILQMSEQVWLKSYLTLLSKYRVDEVKSIEKIEDARTFDFAMEKTHSFIADGIVNHNTTVVLAGMAQAQKMNPDKMVAYIDSEFAFDPVYAENLGLDLSPERFVFAQPEHGEEVFDVVEEFLKTGEFCFIAVDSVAAMVPRAELEGEIGESKMGLHARLMSQGMRKLVGLISKSNCILYFTNQLRDNIGVIYGSPEVTTGGNALKFYASQRLDIRKKDTLKDGDTAYANNVRITVKKNKVAPPFTKCETTIEFGQGISLETEIVNLAIENDFIKKSGSWLTYDKIKVQGISSFVELLKEDLTTKEELTNKIKEIYNID